MKVYKLECPDFFDLYENEFIYLSLEKAKNRAKDEINAMIIKINDENEERLANEDFAYYFVKVEDKKINAPVEAYPEVFKSISKVSDYIIEVEYTPDYDKNQTWEFKVNYNMFRDGETYTDYNFTIKIKEFELIE